MAPHGHGHGAAAAYAPHADHGAAAGAALVGDGGGGGAPHGRDHAAPPDNGAAAGAAFVGGGGGGVAPHGHGHGAAAAYAPHAGAGAAGALAGGGDVPAAHPRPKPRQTGPPGAVLPAGAPFRTTFHSPGCYLKYFGLTEPDVVKAHKFDDDDKKPMPCDVYVETVYRGGHGPDNYFYFTGADGKLAVFFFRSNKECVRFKEAIFQRLPTLWAEAVEAAAMDDRVMFDWKSIQSLTTLRAVVENIERCDEDVFKAYMEENLQTAMEDVYEDIMGHPPKKQKQD